MTDTMGYKRPYHGMNYVGNCWWVVYHLQEGNLTNKSSFYSVNPRTEEVIGEFPQTTDEEVIYAVEVATKAQKEWRQLSRVQRGEYFDRLCQIIKNDTPALVKAISEETGKHENESLAEVNEALHMCQYTFGKSRMPNGDVIPSEIADKDSYVLRKPKGVIAVISPWNFPYAIGGFWCSAPALLEGNTVIWKPSEDTPMVAQMAIEQYQRAGFPEGVINLLHGDGHVGSELVYNKGVRHYCFTGSHTVGKFIRQICALQDCKTCSLEMGSKSAVIVCADANMDMAVKACVASAYKLSGQRCVSAGRILVEQSIFDEFAAKFVEESKKIELAPLINKAQVERVRAYNLLTMCDSENTQILLRYEVAKMCSKCKKTMQENQSKYCGDGSDKDNAHNWDIGPGFFITPHVYTTKWKVPESRKFLAEEVFGPHVALLPFDNLDEAINIYNDTNFGLSCAILTSDYRKMRRVRNECEFGLGYVNLPCIGAESGLPFGGVKNSGYGGSSAAGTFDTVVNKVTWTVNHGEDIQMAQGLKI